MNPISKSATAFLFAALAVGSLLTVFASEAPTARAATNLDVCGTVNAYIQPTALTAGAITIGGTPYVIAAGTDVSGQAAGDIEAGAHLCLHLSVNSSGSITDLVAVGADATTHLKICGLVVKFDDATALHAGSLTIGDHTLTVAAGADLPASVKVGADICAKFDLNGFGQVRDGDISANATSTVDVCGVVNAYGAASATHTGDLSIGGQDFVVAMGANLPAAIKAGADLCATLELNGFGQVQDGQVDAGATTTLTVCGEVTAYAAATSANSGAITIGGVSKTIKAGTDVDARVRAGAFLKLRLTVNAEGKVTDAAVLRVGVSLADACGGATPSNAPNPTPTATPENPGGPTPTPTPETPGGPNPTPTPETPGGPTPPATPPATPVTPGGPTPTPPSGSGPTPTPTFVTPGGPTPAPTPTEDVCGPDGANGSTGGTGSGAISAPELPASATSVVRAGYVVATAAMPFLVFALAMIVGSFVAWTRRRMSAPSLTTQEEAAE